MSAQDEPAAIEPNVTILPADQPINKPAEAPAEVIEEAKQEPEAKTDEAEDGQEAERDEKGRFKPKLQERIDELTKARGTAEREAAYWKGVAEAAKPQQQDAKPSKPTLDQFEDYSAYVEALTDWKADQKIDAKFAERDVKQSQQAKASTWQQRAEAAKAEMPDFAEVLNASQAPMTQAMAEVLQESDHGPAIAYHLAKNPNEADRIAHLSPLAQARELGKIEASLSAPKETPAPKKVTSAPPPPTPIGSGRSTAGEPGKMTQAEYMAWRQTALRT